MTESKTYISFVIQRNQQHIHDSAIVQLPQPETSLYNDTTSQEVVNWSNKKQLELGPGEKLVLINFFTISSIH